MNQKEAENKGIDISMLPQTKIDVTGATEGKITNWRKMNIHIRSNETGMQHKEDIYILEHPVLKNINLFLWRKSYSTYIGLKSVLFKQKLI